LESTLLNHSGTVFKSCHSWGVSWCCPWKGNKCFVETFCWVKIKKLPFSLCRKHKLGRLCQKRNASYVETAVQEVGLGGERNFRDKAIDR
jgi:hypothetical protein